ncbi:MAG: putative lipid II flippase FtsW [Deltaproteobacteria bacterium]|nr:putative lipid II flippase FtsW [Deltaproteobacteria bacterium]MBW2651559.1 putative lipid II flippase FtsW [Deltaproteobacteria bacterium]
MEKRKFHDHVLPLIVLTFVIIGIVMVYSSSSISASNRFGDSTYFLKRQLYFAAIGFLLMLLAMKIRYQILTRLVYPILITSLLLLIFVLIPGIGTTIGGSMRWFRFGPLSFQPSEFAKLALIIFLAYSLSNKEKKIKSFSIGFLPHMIVTLFMFALVLLQPDFGTAVILLLLFFVLVFAAGSRVRYLAYFAGIASVGCYFLISSVGYRLDRITSFLNPWEDPTSTGFQIIQSFLAFGSGGLWGTGLGNGKQKLFYLPEPHTDFIFSIIGEELGFIGVLLLIILFIFLAYCGIRICLKAPDLFGTYLALGITSLIVLHAVINLGVVMGLLPTKGSTLPFISYGGTSLVINFIGVGILLNISSQLSVKRRS